jgi:hypothetical protein
MRIYNCDTERTLQNVELYLTSVELEDLMAVLCNYIELNKEEFFDSGNLFGQDDGFNVKPSYAEFAVYSNVYIENMDSTSKRIIFTDK